MLSPATSFSINSCLTCPQLLRTYVVITILHDVSPLRSMMLSNLISRRGILNELELITENDDHSSKSTRIWKR